MSDYYEVAPLSEHHLRLVYGPAAMNQHGGSDIRASARQFSELAAAPTSRMLLDWWLEKVSRTGAVPTNDRSWIADLAPLSRILALCELEAASGHMRYRYFGEDIASRLGIELSGTRMGEFNGMSDDALWDLWGPLATEGRPVYVNIGYGALLGKSYVKADIIAVPLADEHGEVRFGLAVWDFIDTGGAR